MTIFEYIAKSPDIWMVLCTYDKICVILVSSTTYSFFFVAARWQGKFTLHGKIVFSEQVSWIFFSKIKMIKF